MISISLLSVFALLVWQELKEGTAPILSVGVRTLSTGLQFCLGITVAHHPMLRTFCVGCTYVFEPRYREKIIHARPPEFENRNGFVTRPPYFNYSGEMAMRRKTNAHKVLGYGVMADAATLTTPRIIRR